MSWGPCYLCYTCAACGKRYKYDIGLIAGLGDDFGRCPVCGAAGTPEANSSVPDGCPDYEEADA